MLSLTSSPDLPLTFAGIFMTRVRTLAIVGLFLGHTIVDNSFPPKSGLVPLKPPFSSTSREVQSSYQSSFNESCKNSCKIPAIVGTSHQDYFGMVLV